ncbi:hypothetical protein B0H19DRAFT_1247481 [Mycena capillaripes]|nr:hypothetical protein B0H19DRAFT_1247481 [Mycena capillaripes]
MDAFTTILSAVVYISSSSSPASQRASAGVEDLPQIDTVDYDRNNGSLLTWQLINSSLASFQDIEARSVERLHAENHYTTHHTYPMTISPDFEILLFNIHASFTTGTHTHIIVYPHSLSYLYFVGRADPLYL